MFNYCFGRNNSVRHVDFDLPPNELFLNLRRKIESHGQELLKDDCSLELSKEKDISKSFQVPNYDDCASVDCILDYAKQKKLMKHRESNSSTSEDLIEQEAKLNAGMNPLSNDIISDGFPDLQNKKTSAEIQQGSLHHPRDRVWRSLGVVA